MVTTSAPVVGSYGGYVGSIHGSQVSSVGIGVPPEYYSEELSREDFDDEVLFYARGGEFGKTYTAYIGSRDGFHFVLVHHIVGPRKIYRIKEEELRVLDVFPLTLDRNYWVSLSKALGTDVFPEVGLSLSYDEFVETYRIEVEALDAPLYDPAHIGFINDEESELEIIGIDALLDD
ncbi:MAG: hypothetical protein ACPGN3_15285 [Opitutales bacterium]